MKLLGANRQKQAKARKQARQIRERILKHCQGATRAESGKSMGLGPNDIANLRAGNGVSLIMIVRLIEKGKFTPTSILGGKSLRKLPRGTSTRSVRTEQITKRIRKIAMAGAPQEIAKKTGLAAVTVYQFRTKPPETVSLQTILCFMDAGYSADFLLLGKGNP